MDHESKKKKNKKKKKLKKTITEQYMTTTVEKFLSKCKSTDMLGYNVKIPDMITKKYLDERVYFNVDIFNYNIRIVDTHIALEVKPSGKYYEDFPLTRIDLVTVDDLVVHFVADMQGEDIVIKHIYNYIFATPYDDIFYPSWETRRKEINNLWDVTTILIVSFLNYLVLINKLSSTSYVYNDSNINERAVILDNIENEPQVNIEYQYHELGFREDSDGRSRVQIKTLVKKINKRENFGKIVMLDGEEVNVVTNSGLLFD